MPDVSLVLAIELLSNSGHLSALEVSNLWASLRIVGTYVGAARRSDGDTVAALRSAPCVDRGPVCHAGTCRGVIPHRQGVL